MSIAGDDKVYPLVYEPMAEDLAGSLERELSAYSLEEDEGKEGEEDEEEEEEDEVVGEEEKKPFSSSSEDFRPFILPPIWLVNDFIPKMTKDVFNRLCPRFQILDVVPIRIARKKREMLL